MSTEKIRTEVLNLFNQSFELYEKSEIEKSWAKLAEAHIISQPFAGLHTLVHWQMLNLAIREKNLTEVFGQLLRLFVAAPGSVLKKYPLGNSGRSNVNMFKPQPIDSELQEKIKQLNE